MGRPAKYVYSINQTIGDFECIDIIKDEKNCTKYIMRCQKCGKIKHMLGSTINRGSGISHRSCGKGLGIAFDEYFYKRWQSMRYRTSPNSPYAENYYNRGIHSDAFASFIDFYNAMYESWKEHVACYGEHDTSLERIDVDKPYSPENCCWICLDEQKGNMQKTIYFTVKDLETNTVKYCKNAYDYALKNNISTKYIYELIHKNRVYCNKQYTLITKQEYADYNKTNNIFN